MCKKIVYGLLVGTLFLIIAGMAFSGQSETGSYQKISAAQARTIMESGEPYVLLDVRTEAEMRERHIEGAILIPHTEIRERAASVLPDKDALILVYCRSGSRSASAAQALVQMGYKRVYDFGGIKDWPYETVSGPGGVKR